MKKLILLFVLLNSIVKAQVPPACFTLASTPSVGLNPQAICTADFNNDGKADLAVANYSSNNVSILLGLGTGSFASVVNFSVGVNPQSICTGDFNGDSNADLAVGCNTFIAIFLGNGTGTFSIITSNIINYSGGNIITNDFNGDSKLDILFISGTNVSLILGSGNGSFSSITSSLSSGTPSSLITNDFNNDGKLDYAVGGSFPSNVNVYLGLGTGSFVGTATANFFPSGGPALLLSADFNNDSKMDLMITESGLLLATGIGNGSFNFYYNNISTVSGSAFINADYNGDANQDIVVTTYNGVKILLGIGNGSFVAPVNFVVGSFPNSLTNADFNNDGKIDVAVVNGSSNNVSILINTSGGTIPNVNVVSSASLICSGQSATLTASGANSYLWGTGATTNTIIVSPYLNTTYTVYGTGIDGCVISSNITQSVSSCTGINSFDNNKDLKFYIYPNPANEVINIEFLAFNNEAYTIEILNSLGQVIREEEIIFKDNKTGINTKDLENGLYFLNFKNNKQLSVNKRFVIAR